MDPGRNKGMKTARLYACVVLRMAIGGLFVVSGLEKLLSPYQNFLYVVQGYEVFPPGVDRLVAHIVPWLELFLGTLFVVGLATSMALAGLMALFVGFIIVVGQAILRRLPLTECGCLGELISFPLPVIIIMDSSLLAVCVFLWRNRALIRHFGLDRLWDEE